MSEQSPEHKTPFLPLEVCFKIIEYATLVPNAFDTHAPDVFAYPAPMSQDQIQEGIRESLCTTCRIVLVCKAWNSYATPLLYKAIRITQYKSVDKVLWTFRNSTNTSPKISGNEGPKGRSTIRLDIDLLHYSFRVSASFVELLRHLPNLQILVVRISALDGFLRSPLSFLSVIGKNPIPTLKVFDFRSCHDPWRSFCWSTLFVGFPLRVLRVRPQTLSILPEPTLDLQELEYLDVPKHPMRAALTGKSPAELFPRLCIDGENDSRWEVFEGLPSRMRACLSSLEIHYNSPCLCGEVYTVRTIADICPNLEELIVDFKEDDCVRIIEFWRLPHIKRLGLRFCANVVCEELYLKLGEELGQLKSRTPSLKVVRIVSGPSLVHLKKRQRGAHEMAQKASAYLLLGHNVRFEDCNGRLFHDAGLEDAWLKAWEEMQTEIASFPNIPISP